MATLVNSLPTTGAHGAVHTGGATGSLLGRMSGWLAEQRRYRRTVAELSTLSDRELADIGITRGDVEFVARRSARGA